MRFHGYGRTDAAAADIRLDALQVRRAARHRRPPPHRHVES